MVSYKAWIGENVQKSMFVKCDTLKKAEDTVEYFNKEVAPVLMDAGEPSMTGIEESKECVVCKRPVFEEVHHSLCPRCENQQGDVQSMMEDMREMGDDVEQ